MSNSLPSLSIFDSDTTSRRLTAIGTAESVEEQNRGGNAKTIAAKDFTRLTVFGAAFLSHWSTSAERAFAHYRAINITQPTSDKRADGIKQLHHDFLGAVEQRINGKRCKTKSQKKHQTKEKRAQANPNDRAFAAVLMHWGCAGYEWCPPQNVDFKSIYRESFSYA